MYIVSVLLGEDQLRTALNDLASGDTVISITQDAGRYTLVYKEA